MPGMMDKGSEYLGKGRSNGTKSPSNASNGHFSDESGSDDEHGEYSLEQPLVAPYVAVLNGIIWLKRLLGFMWIVFADVGMRVGADYQANIPEFEPGEIFLLSTRVTDGGSLGHVTCTVAVTGCECPQLQTGTVTLPNSLKHTDTRVNNERFDVLNWR